MEKQEDFIDLLIYFLKRKMSEGEGPEWDSSLLTPRDLKTRPPTLRPLPTRSRHTHSRFVSNTPSAPLIPPGPDGHQLD